jgi:hypothetical protein
MKQAFFKELSGFVRDDVPELVIGASDVDVALQFEQLFTRPDVQAFLKSFDWVEPSEVLHAQEVWGTYRDQFVQFMKKARSNVDESVWKNWLNRQRIERLKGFEKTIGWMG